MGAPNAVPRNAAPCPSEASSGDIGPHEHGGCKAKGKVSAGLVLVESVSCAWCLREDRAREDAFSSFPCKGTDPIPRVLSANDPPRPCVLTVSRGVRT